jgi:gliding motility-associated-like protein
VYSNTILGEAVTFKMYDASTGILVNAANKLTFQSDANTGNMAAPYIITTNQNPTDIALSSAEIMEGKEAGSEIGIFTATDPDKGADADYSYKLVAGAADNANFSVSKDTLTSAAIFDYDLKPTHTILIEVSDGKGGIFQKQMTINIAVDPNQFSANNYISPNGDLKNDFWVIKNIEVYQEHQITIYNDAGIVVLSKRGYNNDWDGTYEGKKLPTGVYYFIVKSPDDGRKFTGSISLNR